MTNKLLWLDDSRDPMKNDWLVFSPIGRNIDTYWVKSYNEFVKWITKNGLPDGICFDHDLGDYKIDKITKQQIHQEKTGMDCAKWLVDYCLDNKLQIPKYSIQSSNPSGKENIGSLLENYKKFFIKE